MILKPSAIRHLSAEYPDVNLFRSCLCVTHWSIKFHTSVADLHSKILDARPPRGSKFFQFHAVFGKFWRNCMLAPPLGSWRPLLGVTCGSMIISLLMNITMNQLGGASVIAIFTTRRSHGYVNTTTWLGISQFFLFLAPNFNILTTENRSICNRDLN